MSKELQIFCFHSISSESSPSYPSLSVKVFDKVCTLLKRHYFILPLQEIGSRVLSKKPLSVITFDDGFYDFYQNALPVLVKHKLHATQHLIVDCVNTGQTLWSQKLNNIVDAYYHSGLAIDLPMLGVRNQVLKSKLYTKRLCLQIYLNMLKDNSCRDFLAVLEKPVADIVRHTRMLNWAEVKECQKYDISFGSHTYSHKNLIQLTENELSEELSRAKMEIEFNNNQAECLSLAYPNGQYNDAIKEAGKKAGYKFLLTSNPRSSIFPYDPFDLPRINVFNESYWVNKLKILHYRFFN